MLSAAAAAAHIALFAAALPRPVFFFAVLTHTLTTEGCV